MLELTGLIKSHRWLMYFKWKFMCQAIKWLYTYKYDIYCLNTIQSILHCNISYSYTSNSVTVIWHFNISVKANVSRSQWLRSLRHELFACSNTGIVGLNPTWGMDVCVHLFCVSAVLCVQVAALRRADPLSKESYWLCKISRDWRAAKVQQRALEQ
jgi:hypothetical protein